MESDVDIIDDQRFRTSNMTYKAALVELKRIGKGSVDHHPEITPQDLKKLYDSFKTDSAVELQEKVLFDIIYYLCRRGRENLRDMSKDTFAIRKDSMGKAYVCQVKDELDKNHRETDKPDESITVGRMYETGGIKCPVMSYRLYLDKLHPESNFLWQRPRTMYSGSDTWFCNVPIGKNTLGGFMSKLSKKHNLSMIYTNHSIRATSVTVMDEADIEARHIMKVSGHKSESSIRSYARRICEPKLADISNILSEGLYPTDRSSQKSSDTDIVEVEPTFELKVNISSSEESIEYELQNVPDVLDANQKVVHSVSSSSTERIVSSTATSAVVKKTSASTVVSASKCPGTHHQDHSHTIPPVAGSMQNCVINLNQLQLMLVF